MSVTGHDSIQCTDSGNVLCLCCSVFGSIVFGAVSISQAMELSSETSRAQLSSARVFQLIDADAKQTNNSESAIGDRMIVSSSRTV